MNLFFFFLKQKNRTRFSPFTTHKPPQYITSLALNYCRITFPYIIIFFFLIICFILLWKVASGSRALDTSRADGSTDGPVTGAGTRPQQAKMHPDGQDRT